MKNQPGKKEGIWSKIDMHILIPGAACLLLIVVLGAAIPDSFNSALLGALDWIMAHFKWVYVLCVLMVTALCVFILFSKWGNIRLGGKDAKPSLKNSTWFTLSITGTIAVGICFYGVSGPVNLFMNPPAFLGVAGGTPEAVVPTLEYCFLHYGVPPFFLICCVALVISLVYYNGRQTLKASSTLSPLMGDKCHGIIGTLINILVIICMIDCGTNMGLAVIQLNSGIGTVAGMSETPSFEPYIVIVYTALAIVFACSGVHKLMGKLSNFNAICYFAIMLFVLLVGPAGGSRLLTLGFESLGQYIQDFIPMISFGDSVSQTGWQNNNTMFYYSWNLVPGLLQALFYVSIAYGRTLRQFILVNCILPAFVTMGWYTLFGGTAMFGILDGSGLWETIQEFGSGISTFAFLDTLPLGSIMKWVFLVVAVMTFLTFSDGVAFSFPMLMVKDSAVDASYTKVPRALNVGVSLFMGALTFMLLYVGGYDALNSVMVALAFPAAILMVLVMFSFIKFLRHRDKYDVTYQEELAAEEKPAEAACECVTAAAPED